MKRKSLFVLLSTCLLAGIIGVIIIGQKGKAETRLSEEEIARLRLQYPVSDMGSPLINSIIPEGWGLNFGTIFECYDAIITGKVTSEITASEKKLTMVDEGDWEESLEELKEQNLSLIEMPYVRYYWTFEVDEVLWKGKREEAQAVLEELSSGDTILFSISDFAFCHEELIRENQEYLWTVGWNEVTGDYEVIRRGSFYKTEDDYLFSFVSGNNTNCYTGMKLSSYKKALTAAEHDPQLAGEAWDYLE